MSITKWESSHDLRLMSKNSWRKCQCGRTVGRSFIQASMWSLSLSLSPFTICLVLYEAFSDIDHRSRAVSFFPLSDMDVSDWALNPGRKRRCYRIISSLTFESCTCLCHLKLWTKTWIMQVLIPRPFFFPLSKLDFEHINSFDFHQPR